MFTFSSEKRTRGYGHVQIMADNRWHARKSARVDITRKKERKRNPDSLMKLMQDTMAERGVGERQWMHGEDWRLKTRRRQ